MPLTIAAVKVMPTFAELIGVPTALNVAQVLSETLIKGTWIYFSLCAGSKLPTKANCVHNHTQIFLVKIVLTASFLCFD